MKEIYWLTVLGNLRIIVIMIFGALILVGIVSVVLYAFSETATTEITEEFSRFLKKTGLSIFLISIVLCFIPSKEDMLAIYGIGGTIDYIQSNDKAKQLPDKVVDALTEYLENINKDTDANEPINNR